MRRLLRFLLAESLPVRRLQAGTIRALFSGQNLMSFHFFDLAARPLPLETTPSKTAVK